mmetsp:Transcript_7262/g.20473  ORF Transcript_7262/g.20473 Transcript_7262/m.20473 type:complete len:206 (+) Transcript_7262:1228-1845(+)
MLQLSQRPLGSICPALSCLGRLVLAIPHASPRLCLRLRLLQGLLLLLRLRHHDDLDVLLPLKPAGSRTSGGRQHLGGLLGADLGEDGGGRGPSLLSPPMGGLDDPRGLHTRLLLHLQPDGDPRRQRGICGSPAALPPTSSTLSSPPSTFASGTSGEVCSRSEHRFLGCIGSLLAGEQHWPGRGLLFRGRLASPACAHTGEAPISP